MVRVENLTRIYKSGTAAVTVFENLNLVVAAGEQIAIMGASGAGKSTLLHLIAGLDSPTAGSIFFGDREVTRMSQPESATFRNHEIGYVWQQHHLMPDFTALENTMMPLLIRGDSESTAAAAAKISLTEVGLADRLEHRAGELSGGEQQRVAIARALAGSPSLLLADEPTGNLDEATGEAVFRLLGDLRARRGLTSILVTHNAHFARTCSRVLKLQHGGLHPAS